MNILAVGDVVNQCGLDMFCSSFYKLKKQYSVDFTIVDGENIRGAGLLPRDAEQLYQSGADVITLGNHALRKQEIRNFLDDREYILRPINFAPQLEGRGAGVYNVGGIKIKVINAIGRCYMDFVPDNPFFAVEDEIKTGREADITIVDFHAEATSEKIAMGYFLDGRVSAVFGTHTHVQTADHKILPKGTGYISDIGMTGVYQSVLGVKPEDSIAMFTGDFPQRLRPAEGPCTLCGALFEIDGRSGRCTAVRPIAVGEQEI